MTIPATQTVYMGIVSENQCCFLEAGKIWNIAKIKLVVDPLYTVRIRSQFLYHGSNFVKPRSFWYAIKANLLFYIRGKSNRMFLLEFPERKLKFKQKASIIFAGNVFLTNLSKFFVIMATESKSSLKLTQTNVTCFCSRAMLSCIVTY